MCWAVTLRPFHIFVEPHLHPAEWHQMRDGCLCVCVRARSNCTAHLPPVQLASDEALRVLRACVRACAARARARTCNRQALGSDGCPFRCLWSSGGASSGYLH